MVECRRSPGSGGMAGLAVGTELVCGMGRIVCIVVIGQVAADAGSRDGIVVNSVMALLAGGGDMRTGERPVGIMDSESGRFPSRVGGMAILAGRRYVCSLVRRVRTGVIICLVAAHTGIGRGGIVPVVALVAACRGVGAGECIIVAMNGECHRLPSGVGSMAEGTFILVKPGCLVIRV